tara:strand:- start:132 stop:815 length:684 start_codon:yes stop_codon:yes gene_type:complete
MAVVVIGANCSLGEAVIDKLLSKDVEVIAKEPSHSIRNQDVLKFSKTVLKAEGQGFTISFDGSDAEIVIGRDIIIHDLIPSRIDKWVAPELLDWVNGIEPSEVKPRYWVSVIDAAEAISEIVRSHTIPNAVHLCGRREWLPEDSRSEIKMLWDRTSQGHTGDFAPETLFPKDLSGMKVKKISQKQSERPDLEPLHDLLTKIGLEEGWRPLIPFRTALMSFIAGIWES